MRVLRQFDALVIDDFEESVYSYPDHAHTYYELVYIHKGSGNHHLNNNIMPYKQGDIFLTSPGDHHFFDIRKSTHFTFIKFNDSYFSKRYHLAPDEFRDFTPESIMQLKIVKETKLELDEPCNTILRKTVENIVSYNCRKDVSTSPIVFYQLLSILGLVKEAVAKLNVRIQDGLSCSNEELSSYIHQYIYDREKISVEEIARHFNIARNYFSTYFKRRLGISYRSYIESYRIKLIERRLLSGGLTLKQIADEFDYADESHLIKSFRKYKGMSPSAFRKQSVRTVGEPA